MWRALALGLLVTGCHASLADEGTDELTVDASPGMTGTLLDAPNGVILDASVPIDAAPPPAKRVVFLNFDGVTLTKGTSDATLNQASWLFNAQSGTAPAYQVNGANRAANITTIVTGVTGRLANIATVTQTRPTSGTYVMVVYGGANGTIHSAFATAVNELDCGDVNKSDVAWINDGVSTANAINLTMGAIGFGLGLSSTTTTSDCMCSWGNACQPAGDCTLHNGIARDTNVGNNPNGGQPQDCPGVTTQDELTTFQTAFQ